MRTHGSRARVFLAAVVVVVFAGGAPAQDESTPYDGFYLGSYMPYTTMWEDFDGRHLLTDPHQALLRPDIHGGSGWGVIAGFRRGWFAGELTFQQSRHDWTMQMDVDPLPMRGRAEINSLALNAKAFLPVDGPVQPYVLAGPSLTFLTVKRGSIDTVGSIGDAEYSDVGGNLGCGVAVYIGHSVCLSAGVQYHATFFDSYKGEGGRGHLPGGDDDDDWECDHRLQGDGFTYLVSLTFTF